MRGRRKFKKKIVISGCGIEGKREGGREGRGAVKAGQLRSRNEREKGEKMRDN